MARTHPLCFLPLQTIVCFILKDSNSTLGNLKQKNGHVCGTIEKECRCVGVKETRESFQGDTTRHSSTFGLYMYDQKESGDIFLDIVNTSLKAKLSDRCRQTDHRLFTQVQHPNNKKNILLLTDIFLSK